MPPAAIVAVLDDLFFTVKINEAAKRSGQPVVFVKSEKDALDQAALLPSLVIVDLNCAVLDPLRLIRIRVARPGRAQAGGPASRLRYGAGALGLFAEPPAAS